MKVCYDTKIPPRFRRLGIYFLYSDHSPSKAMVIELTSTGVQHEIYGLQSSPFYTPNISTGMEPNKLSISGDTPEDRSYIKNDPKHDSPCVGKEVVDLVYSIFIMIAKDILPQYQ